MKKFLLPVTAVLTVAVFFASCSMEKRHYRPGYHVEWKNNKTTSATGTEQTSVNTNETTTAVQSFQSPVTVENAAAPQQTPAAAPAPVTVVKSKSVIAKSVVANAAVEKAGNENNVSAVKSVLKQANKNASRNQPAGGGNDNTVLLVILAILIPPLAVYLYEGSWTKRCTINLILTLLCGLPGMIHALIVVLS